MVMISEETSNNMMENIHVMKSKANYYDWLMESKDPAGKGHFKTYDLVEVDGTKVFTENSWKDYVYWQTEDKKTLKKILSIR